MSDQECFYFSRFEPTIDAGGGARRLVQVMEALESLNCELISAARRDRLNKQVHDKSNSKTLKWLKKYFLMGGEYVLWSNERRDGVYRLRCISNEWGRLIKELPELKLAIVDDPIYFIPLVKKLKKYRIPIVALCHNIETLASYLVAQAHQRTLFNKELDILGMCDLVVTISREETLLLNNLNINTIFFPYYPVEKILNRMLRVRNKRRKTDKKDVILIGSAGNIVTEQGMIKAISQWREHRLDRFGGKLLVAGYKTDAFLKNIKYDNNTEFLGPLPNEELDKRLSSVRACLCYQEGGGGALTRICEMLIAGVPVLANSYAARSYYNIDGLIEFSCFTEFKEAFLKIESIEGHIPVPTPPDASFLLCELKSLFK
jgi:glycosyltransferase involved in cell wall biosynthesis